MARGADLGPMSSRSGVDPQGDAYFVWERADIIQTHLRESDGTLTAVQDLTG